MSMDKEQALDRLRARCSREEVSSGMALALLRKWSSSHSGAGRSGNGAGNCACCLSERDMAGIIALLVREKFIDDVRFAGAFVRDKLKFNGWGKRKIVFKLKSLGVDDDIIEEALRRNYYVSGCAADGGVCDEAEGLSGQKVLERLLEKKWRSLKEDEPLQVRKAKAVRFVAGRGFEYGDIIAALAKIM